MEQTHFERVMTHTQKYDQAAKHFARKAVADGNMAEALWNTIDEGKKKMPLQVSEKDLVRTLLPLNARVMRYVHCITQELLKKQEDPYALTDLTELKDFGPVIGMACASNDPVVINASGHMHYHMACHAMAGRRVYSVSSGLADQLRHTDRQGLHADDLVLPYKSVYLEVPESAALQIWNDISGWHTVVGIYLTEQTLPSRSWRFLVCGEMKPIEVMKGVYDDNDALVYFQVPLPERISLNETIALSQDQCVKDVAELKKHGVDSFGEMVEIWPHIFRWAMNVVLYMSLHNSESEDIVGNKEARRLIERIKKLPGGKKRSKLSGRLSKLDQCRRTILGKSVTVNRGSWQLSVRVRVRGHIRNQPYGPGRMYRRLQWIEPYFKGPEDGEMANAITEVASTSPEKGTPNEPWNGESDLTFGRVATLPTEGVVSGDQLLDGGSEAEG